MASSHQIFTSFHGPDVRTTILSHLRQQFEHNGITMFDDNEMPRSQLIAPTLTQAIRESRISIVLLSRNYASSSWCLDELLEILKCKEERGQIVMTIFYGVDPSHVRKQTGDFGISFNETCALKTDEERSKWSQALTYVANIAGEDFKDCKNEAKMIEKIAKDVFNKLNVTPSRDSEGMVGLDVHMKKIKSMLEMDSDTVKIVGIYGPAGIGKSTIARALHSQLSSSFTRSCFLDNLRGRYHGGSDEYTLKLGLQGQLLSEILKKKCMTIGNLDMVKYWLHDKKVLIILDDVECLDQLEALADIEWFGPGSRVLVTTENKEIMEQHGITDIYHVGFPSKKEALKIFCQSAFRQTYPPYGFKDLAYEVVSICGNLPLGLKVLGSSMRGKSKDKWIDELPRLKNCLDRRIEYVLKVGYESLHEKDQELFLFIGVFFNNEDVDHVTSMLVKPNLNVWLMLENLANRCLIEYKDGKVVMHHLLQVLATQVISQQEVWKRRILADAQQICYILENGKGDGTILGISFDVADINKLKINGKAFERLYNLLFLEIYNSQELKLRIPDEMEFVPRLRLLRWDAYPRKSLPLRFCPENLIELNMFRSQLEKLWEGTQPIVNLKRINLLGSSSLKELPDLSNATNLETLDLWGCYALVELPSSISNLHKLVTLNMWWCKSLETIPNLANLTSLGKINMAFCPRLRSFSESIRHCSRIDVVFLQGSRNLKTFLTHLPTNITEINLYESGIERITDCIKHLHRLKHLFLSSCKRLVSLPELPCSLQLLYADNCESLERVSGPLNTPHAKLRFINCFKLDGQSRQAIIQRHFVKELTVLPGREVPEEYDYRARGDSLTIPHSDFNRFKVCLVLSPGEAENRDEDNENEFKVSEGRYVIVPYFDQYEGLGSEHLLIFHDSLPFIDISEVRKKIVLQFYNSFPQDFHIIECGIQINGNNNEEDDGNNLLRRKRVLLSNEASSDEEEKSSNEDYESEFSESSDREDDEYGYKSESSEASDKENYESESGKSSEKEDDEEGYKSESSEASDEEDYESESNKSSDNEDDEEGYKSETRQASDDEYEGLADKSVTRKRPRKTTVITNLKKRRS